MLIDINKDDLELLKKLRNEIFNGDNDELLSDTENLIEFIEYEFGKLTQVRKISKPLPVEEYLKLQGRYKHVLDNPEEIKKIQDIANQNIEKYNLLAQPVSGTASA